MACCSLCMTCCSLCMACCSWTTFTFKYNMLTWCGKKCEGDVHPFVVKTLHYGLLCYVKSSTLLLKWDVPCGVCVLFREKWDHVGLWRFSALYPSLCVYWHVCPAPGCLSVHGSHRGCVCWWHLSFSQAELICHFYVGETVLSIQKTTLIQGGSECLVYSTLSGSIGALVPFTSKEVGSCIVGGTHSAGS